MADISFHSVMNLVVHRPLTKQLTEVRGLTKRILVLDCENHFHLEGNTSKWDGKTISWILSMRQLPVFMSVRFENVFMRANARYIPIMI